MHRDDGRLGFVAIELTPRIETETDFVTAAKRTALIVGDLCAVSLALAVPVEIVPVVRAVEPALV